MAAYNNFILTNQGIGLLADLMNGNGEMEFRYLAVGSGSYATEEKNLEEIRGMEGLKEERQRVMFSSIGKAEDGFVNLKANLTNKDLEEGYPMTEAGIYVGKKGEQEEILYCVSTVDKPDYMPNYSSKQIYNVIYKMMISIGDVSNPTISYKTDIYALAEDLQEEVRRAAEAEDELQCRKLDVDGDASDTVINFLPAESLEPLQSGGEQKELLGQMAKAVVALIAHLEDKFNPHKLKATQAEAVSFSEAQSLSETQKATARDNIGLDNLDNTPDKDKPVSTAQQAALDALYEQLTAYVLQKIADLIGGAPATLDTLGEIAKAMQDNESVVAALDEAIGKKANAGEFDSHLKDTTAHITSAERNHWNSKSDNGHTHDDRYYTESEIDTKLNGKANSSHTHDYASTDHTHSYNDLSNKPTIPNVPDSLPADGGNADTVDGYHAYQLQNCSANGKPETTHIKSTYAASHGTFILKAYNASGSEICDVEVGRADTVDGKHASDFAPASHTHDYAAMGHDHNGTSPTFDSVELKSGTPFIDFHYGDSDADYTSRIIENAPGTLEISGDLQLDGTLKKGNTPVFRLDTSTKTLYITF